MSFLVAGLVLKTKTGLSPTQKLILLGIAEHARPDGTAAWPSIETLGRYSEVSRSTVQRALRAIQEAEWIALDTQANNKRPATYSVNVGRLEAAETNALLAATSTSLDPPTSASPEGESRGVNLTPQEKPGVSPVHARGVKSGDLGVSPVTPEPTPEPVLKGPKHVLSLFDLERERRYHEKYQFAGSKDGPNAARLLKKIGWDELTSRIQEYIWSDEKKLIDVRHSWGMFVARVNSHGRKLTTSKRDVEAATRRANVKQVASDGFAFHEGQ